MFAWRVIWERRFWKHLTRDDEDFRRHMKHRLIDRVCDQP